MTNEEAFVKELIAYIFYVQDEDDDNLSSEIICRKLHKYELIDRGKNGWTPKEELDCSLCKNWDFDIFQHWRCVLARDNPHWSCDFELKPDFKKMPPADGSTIRISTGPTVISTDPRKATGVCYTNRTESLTTENGWK